MRKRAVVVLTALLGVSILFTGCVSFVSKELGSLFGGSSSSSSVEPSSSEKEAPVVKAPKGPREEPSSAAQPPESETPPAAGIDGAAVQALFDSLEGQWVDQNNETVLYFYSQDGGYGVGLGFYNSEFVSDLSISSVEQLSERVYRLNIGQVHLFSPGTTSSVAPGNSWLDIDLGEPGDNQFTISQAKFDGSVQSDMAGLNYYYDLENN